jgi:hypothetical protein
MAVCFGLWWNEYDVVEAAVAANIVEGRSQKSEREFARFLGYALYSSTELRTMLYGLLECLSESTTDTPPPDADDQPST